MDMSNKKIVITIGKDGSIKKDVFGFKGGDCFEFTKFIDDYLGEPDTQVLKDTFHEQSEKMQDGLPSGYCG